MSRRGFTLVELLVAMAVGGLLGVALTRLLVSDSKFVERQEAMLAARQTARTGLNWTAVELGMVGNGGLLVASPESVTVRIPYAFGITCDRFGSDHIVALAPSDSITYADAVPEGLAWRQPDGSYVLDPGVGVTTTTNTATCDANGVSVVPDGRLVAVSGVPGGGPWRPPPGRIAYLYHSVTYKFAPSAVLPGRLALWRKAGSSTEEELAAPFAVASGFGFLTGMAVTAQDAPPGTLDSVRGVELRLVGASEQVPRGSTTPVTFRLITQLRFRNRTQ
jgi:prepilin-type N-terminal cleavage/methylation domain-containing protein